MKSEELKARLKKLEDSSDRNAYQEFVKNIVPRKDVNEPFSYYKDQLGFGLHVVLTVFTGYLLGYAAFRELLRDNPVKNAAEGVLGLLGGMFVETFLFIIRSSKSNQDFNKITSNRELGSFISSSNLKKKR